MIHTVTIKNHKIMEKKQDAPAKEKFTNKGDGKSLRSRTGTWFECKVKYEKTQKEKRSYNNFLVKAKSLERARRYVDTVMGNTMMDYEIKSLIETKIMDVFEHDLKVSINVCDKGDNK